MLGTIVEIRDGTDELTGIKIATVRVGGRTREINIGRRNFLPGTEINVKTVMRKFGPGHITESFVSAPRPRSGEVHRPRMAVRV